MKILINEKLSQHRYLTPEGYLVCVDSVLARTGKQTYRRNEVFGDAEDDSEIEIDRTPEEVFSEETLASFENKPITVEHPDEDVNSENYKDYAVGFVRDIHRGRDNGQDVILGTLVIQDKKTIDEIKNGEHTDLSCGYDCDITEDEHPQQRNIRGNHVALCAQGRAGNARIVDTAVKDAKRIKEITKGYAILTERDWREKGINAFAERIREDRETAIWEKNSLERGDGISFAIINCNVNPKERIYGMNDEDIEMEDAMTKPEAITIIKKMIVNPKYAHESYDGITYLTPEATSKIAQIAKEAGLTRKDLESIDSFMFGRAGYHIVDDEDIEDEKQIYCVEVITDNGGYYKYAYANSENEAIRKIQKKIEKPPRYSARLLTQETEIAMAKRKGIIDEFEEETGPDMEDGTDVEDKVRNVYTIIYKKKGDDKIYRAVYNGENRVEAMNNFEFDHRMEKIESAKVIDSIEDAPLHTYEIKWMDIYAKSKGWADYKHHDKIKAGTLREALEKLGNSAGFGIGTNNMLIVNIHRDDGRTYTYTDRLANLLKKTDLADEINDAFVAPDTKTLNEIRNKLKTLRDFRITRESTHMGGYLFELKSDKTYTGNEVERMLKPAIQIAKSNGYDAFNSFVGFDSKDKFEADLVVVGKQQKDEKVKDTKRLPDTSELTKIERLLSGAGLVIVQIKYGSASYVYNLKPKGSIFTEYKESDVSAYQSKLANIKNEIEKTYGYPVTYNVELISGRIVITFAVNAKNTKDAVEDVEDKRYKKDAAEIKDVVERTVKMNVRAPEAYRIAKQKYSATSMKKSTNRKAPNDEYYYNSKGKRVAAWYEYDISGNALENNKQYVGTGDLVAVEDAVEDADSFTYKGIFVAKLPHAYRFTLKGKTYEVSTDKEAKEIIDVEIRDSVKDALVEPDEKILKEFERKLSAFKFIVESKKKNYFGGYHYQVRVPGHGFGKPELQFYHVQLGKIEDMMKRYGYPMTHNIGIDSEGRITAGLDMREKYVKDSAKDASETNYKVFVNTNKGKFEYITKAPSEEIAKKKIGKYVAREILKINEKEINNFKINATPLKKGEMDWSKFVYYFNN